MTTGETHEPDEMGAWSDEGVAWVPRSIYPTREAARTWYAREIGEPWIDARVYARYARHDPESEYAESPEWWTECSADEPGAFPVWRCE